MDIGQIKLNNENNSSFNTKVTSLTVGTMKRPYPISLTMKSISEALKPEYWTSLPEKGLTYDDLRITQKKINLEKALADYADYENVAELKGIIVTVVRKLRGTL